MRPGTRATVTCPACASPHMIEGRLFGVSYVECNGVEAGPGELASLYYHRRGNLLVVGTKPREETSAKRKA